MGKNKMSSARAQRRATKKLAKKMLRQSPSNDRGHAGATNNNSTGTPQINNVVFEQAKTLLVAKGWTYFQNVINPTNINGELKMQSTPALIFNSESFLFQLLPYQSGVQLSRLSTWQHDPSFLNASRFIDALLAYLYGRGITTICALPSEIYNTKDDTNAVLTEAQMINLYSAKGFMQEAGSPYWKLQDFSYIKAINNWSEEELNSSCEPGLNYHQFFIPGLVEVYYEFSSNAAKNFMAVCQFENVRALKQNLIMFASALPDDQISSMLKNIIYDVCAESFSNNQSEELSNMAQSILAIILSQAAKTQDYQIQMKILGNALASLLHLAQNGFQNCIIKYRFIFDESKETLNVAFMRADDLKEAA